MNCEWDDMKCEWAAGSLENRCTEGYIGLDRGGYGNADYMAT
jgi:hypothetical protein